MEEVGLLIIVMTRGSGLAHLARIIRGLGVLSLGRGAPRFARGAHQYQAAAVLPTSVMVIPAAQREVQQYPSCLHQLPSESVNSSCMQGHSIPIRSILYIHPTEIRHEGWSFEMPSILRTRACWRRSHHTVHIPMSLVHLEIGQTWSSMIL